MYNSLQTILLKGSDCTAEELQVYDNFLVLLHTAQEMQISNEHKEKHIDACHVYLKTKLDWLEGRSISNGKPGSFVATLPNDMRFKFGKPIYKPARSMFPDAEELRKEESERIKAHASVLASTLGDRKR